MSDYCKDCLEIINPEYTSREPHPNLEFVSTEHVVGDTPLNFVYFKCKVCQSTLLCIDDMRGIAQWM